MIFCDHLGTPVLAVTDAGECTWSQRLDCFGLSRATSHVPFRWPGQYAAPETGLHYNRHRYYDPSTGLYASPDPIGLAGGLALYAYVHDPLAWIDPTGLSGECLKKAQRSKLRKIELLAQDSGRSSLIATVSRNRGSS